MVLRIRDHITHAYTNADGEAIYRLVKHSLLANRPVVVSFAGIRDVTSSFVNSAFIDLLDSIEFDVIKKNLSFVDTTNQINQMIRSRFMFEVKNRVS